MNQQPDNRIKRCKRFNCARATFVETEEGVSVKFQHGSEKHPDVYTVEQMKVYLASKGFIVIEVAKVEKVLKVA